MAAGDIRRRQSIKVHAHHLDVALEVAALQSLLYTVHLVVVCNVDDVLAC